MTTATNPAAVSVLYPMQPMHADLVEPFASVAVRAGALRLWAGQSYAAEPHQVFAYLAGKGITLPVGLGVTLMPLRHPYEAAVQARSLAMLTGQPVVAGYGPATPDFMVKLRGRPYRRPAAAAAAYAEVVRRHVGSPTGFRVDGDAAPYPGVEVGLGVLRPGMARAAGRVADVAITWMTPPGYVRDVLVPALAEGAADRTGPPRIATVVHVGVARTGRDPRKLALAGAGGHLCAPHYTDMLKRAGIPVDPSDPAAGATTLVDTGVYVYGSPAEIAKCVRGYHEAGVDEVILNVAGVLISEGTDKAVADVAEVLEAIGGSSAL